MEHLLQHGLFKVQVGAYSSFNPYFYGTSTSTPINILITNYFLSFQSLFLWNIYFNRTVYLKGEIQDDVSILIFMEHLLQLQPANHIWILQGSWCKSKPCWSRCSIKIRIETVFPKHFYLIHSASWSRCSIKIRIETQKIEFYVLQCRNVEVDVP